METAVRLGVVVVVVRGERFLMIRRAAGVIAPGAWCFVGGGIHPGESQEDAAVREFQEEVGGRIRPVRRVWEYTRPDGKLHLYWWLAELLDGELCPNPAEVAELRWCTADEIEQLPGVLDGNVQFMREVGRGLL
jgi:8-oxo-dGTP diphosphatase